MIGGWSCEKSVLWHAGASSVGIAGVQLCAAEGRRKRKQKQDDGELGGKVYVTASTAEKIDFCKGLGADGGFNYKTTKWDEEVLKATGGKGVDLIIDFVGGGYFGQNLNAVARDGRVVVLGFLGGTKVDAGVDIGAFVRKRCRVEGSSLRSRDLGYQGRLRDLLEERVVPGIVSGELKVVIERVFDWRDVGGAHELMESNQTKGKIICVVT